MTPLLEAYALEGNYLVVGLGCGDAAETGSTTPQLIGHIISNYLSRGKDVLTVRGSDLPLKCLFNHHQVPNDPTRRLLKEMPGERSLGLALSLRPD